MRRRAPELFIALAIALWLAHVAVIGLWGTTPRGALGSDFIQLTLGTILVAVTARAATLSKGVERRYWSIAAVAYLLLASAQFMSVSQDLIAEATLPLWVTLFFSFWSVALGMTLLLDPESTTEHFDPLAGLDFVQGILFLLAAYFYFVLPSRSQDGGDLAGNLRIPYIIYNVLLTGAFFFRSALATSSGAKSFLRRMGIYMLVSCSVDVFYYYGPGSSLRTGAWFDLLWSGVLVVPLVASATWVPSEETKAEENFRSAARNQLLTQLFALIFPVLIVLMSLRIAQERGSLAAVILLLSFACSSARLLLTQKRLLNAQEALRREATHDGLTSVWNHAGILGILDRELLRAQRERSSVGVMMIDVDRFKTINDSHGHAAGDAVLKALVNEITQVLRSYDSLGRYGGEEFLVVAPGCDLAACQELAERVRSHVSEHPIRVQRGSIEVTVSVGVAASADGNVSSGQLLQSADAALYEAKNSGRNQVKSLLPVNTSL